MQLSPINGSHHHQDDLSIVSWSHGIRTLPNHGYIKAFYRYFATSYFGKNASSIIWQNKPLLDSQAKTMQIALKKKITSRPKRKNEQFDKFCLPEIHEQFESLEGLIEQREEAFSQHRQGQEKLTLNSWRNTSVFDYKPFSKVCYIDASSPGAIIHGVKERKRRLMVIPVNAKSAYIVDIHHITGGDLHQINISAPFGEDSVVRNKLKEISSDKVTDQINWRRKFGPYYNSSFRDVKYYSTPKSWSIGWKTTKSNLSMKLWSGAGGEGTTLLEGQSPDPDRDPYSGVWKRLEGSNDSIPYIPRFAVRHHLQDSNGQLKTLTPLIYETESKTSSNKNPITNIKSIIGKNKESLIMKIYFASGRVDYVYSSQDKTPRTMDNIKFLGSGVWLSRPSPNAKPWALVLMKNSSVQTPNTTLHAYKKQTLQINHIMPKYDDKENKTSVLYLKGKISNPKVYINKWMRVDYGAGVNYIYKIKAVFTDPKSKLSQVTIEGAAGMNNKSGQWTHNGYPFKNASTEAFLHLAAGKEAFSKSFLNTIGEKSQ